MFSSNSYIVPLKQILARSLVTVALASTGIGLGIIPEFSLKTLSFNLNTTVLAQNFTNEQITNFARAILEMEASRQQAYSDIKQLIGSGEIPNIICDQPDSLRGLSREVRDIAINYCEKSKQSVTNNGLTIQEFNAMTQAANSNATFKTKVQNELIKLQQ